MTITRRTLLYFPFLLAPALRAERLGGFRRVTAWTSNVEAIIKPDHLKTQVEGKSVKTLRVRGPEDDLMIFIVLDLTGDLSLVDPARQSVVAEIQALPLSVWTAVLRSQDGLHVLSDPTNDRARSVEAINGAQVSGRAGLLETIEPATQLASEILRKSPLRLAVLYLTDSNIYNYREDYTNPVINPSDSRDLSRRFPEGLIREKTSKLANSLAALDAPVFVVHLAYLRDRLNEAYQNGLQSMAEASGGHAAFCRSAADIPGEIKRAFSRIVSHWAIDFEAPENLPRNFTVQLSADDAGLQYRTRFARGK